MICPICKKEMIAGSLPAQGAQKYFSSDDKKLIKNNPLAKSIFGIPYIPLSKLPIFWNRRVESHYCDTCQIIITPVKNIYKKSTIKQYDMVELIADDIKYSEFGILKGDTGVVMENYSIQNEVLVDFSGVDDNGNYYGDCISVNIKDIKKLN